MTSPDPGTFADNLGLLTVAHPWMDPSVSTALAASAPDTNAMLGIADTLKTQTANTWSGLTNASYDPVVEQPYSQQGFAVRSIQGITGGLGFDSSDLVHMQGQLQAQGFGKDLAADGAWSRDWQAALQQHTHEVFTSQQSGAGKPGSTSAHGFLHSVLDAISLSGIASAIVGTIKSLPDDLRQLATDSIGGNLDPTANLFTGGSNATIGSGVNQTLGGSETPEQFKARTQGWNGVASAVNDFGTLAMLVPGEGTLIKAGTKGITLATAARSGEGVVSNSLRNAFTREAGSAAAQRAPQLIAGRVGSNLGKKVVGGVAIGGAVGGIQAAATGSSIETGIGQGLAIGAVGGALLPKTAWENTPVLRQVGPWLDKATDADGWYYRARTLAATPYQYGAVALAGQALGAGQAYSLKVNGLKWLENTVGDDPNSQPIARYVAGSHPLDPINAAISAQTRFTIDGQTFAPNLDSLMYVLHGPLERLSGGNIPGGLADRVSKQGQALLAASDQALGSTGLLERTLRVTREYGHDLPQLMAHAHGDETKLNEWIMDKARHAAAAMHADEVFNKLPNDLKVSLNADSEAKATQMRTGELQAWQDPQGVLKDSMAKLLLPQNMENYETYLRREITATQVSPTEYLRNDLGNYIDAGRAVSQLADHGDSLHTPQEITAALPQAMRGNENVPSVQEFFGDRTRMIPGPGPIAEGALGIYRHGILDSQQAKLDLQGFGQRADALETQRQALIKDWQGLRHNPLVPPEAETAQKTLLLNDQKSLVTDLLLYAEKNHHLDADKLQVYAGSDYRDTINKLLSLLETKRASLVSKVTLAPDASPEARALFAQVENAGYHVGHGTDIGFHFQPHLPVADIGSIASANRRLAQTLGANTERFSRRSLAAATRFSVANALQKAKDANEFEAWPALHSVQTVLNQLGSDDRMSPNLPWAKNVAFALSRPVRRRQITELAERQFGGDRMAAENRLRQNLAVMGGLKDLSRQQVIDNLTSEQNTPWAYSHVTGMEGPAWTAKDAGHFYDVMMGALADSHPYMVGANHLEDLMRFAPYKAAVAHGWDNPKVLTLLSLPDKLARIRDDLRFTLNPLFSARRWFKTNLKMDADGIGGAWQGPIRAMEDQGTFTQDHQLLDALLPEHRNYGMLDDAERYLHNHDVYGLYNPRQYMALYAGRAKRAGWSDDQIKQGITRVFEYGGPGQEGRTALERTTNLVFFPFSFEKTVVRNIGGYLMDHQAQALLLSQSLDAYRQFSADHRDNPLSQQWIADHLPLLDEMARLNTFATGISIGEPGGINRPLLNLFLPQSYANSKNLMHTVGRIVPMLSDFARISKETDSQWQVVRQSVLNGHDIITGASSGPLNRRPAAEIASAQLVDAMNYRNQLLDAFHDVLLYNNAHGADAEKYHFGYGDSIPSDIRGLVIDRSNLGQLVHEAYPAWSPDVGMLLGKARTLKAKQYVQAQHGTDLYPLAKDYMEKAQTAITHMDADRYPPEQAKAVQTLFRQQARDLAAQYPSFRAFYTKTFAYAFGPLE